MPLSVQSAVSKYTNSPVGSVNPIVLARNLWNVVPFADLKPFFYVYVCALYYCVREYQEGLINPSEEAINKSFVPMDTRDIFICGRDSCFWASRVVRRGVALSLDEFSQGSDKKILQVIHIFLTGIGAYYLGNIQVRVLHLYMKIAPTPTGEHARWNNAFCDFIAMSVSLEFMKFVIQVASVGLEHAISEETRQGEIFPPAFCYNEAYALNSSDDLRSVNNALPYGICEINPYSSLGQIFWRATLDAYNLGIGLLLAAFVWARLVLFDRGQGLFSLGDRLITLIFKPPVVEQSG